MSVFADYARYYDLLYRDKDYAAEASFVRELLGRHAPDAASILDLGCGTGVHAALLAAMRYDVLGVDRSPAMLGKANERRAELAPELRDRLAFSEGDVCQVRLGKEFDVVTALFHVISYQTTNEDLEAAFETARVHLRPGGTFIFDCWYGPAVLAQRPEVRVARLEDETVKLTRIAEPRLRVNENCVDVHYQILARRRSDQALDEQTEVHTMRYLFKPEVELLLRNADMRLLSCGGWMSHDRPSEETWGVYFVARRDG